MTSTPANEELDLDKGLLKSVQSFLDAEKSLRKVEESFAYLEAKNELNKTPLSRADVATMRQASGESFDKLLGYLDMYFQHYGDKA